ncbi:MAG: methionyl-tRNA formyltransferase [Kangiellaceae bacterium]
MNQSPLRIAFAGTPDIAAEVLTALIDVGHNIVACYCQPDRKVGRGKKISVGPVKQIALEHGIPVEQPIKFDESKNELGVTAQQQLESYKVDLMIVVAYGLLLPQDVLDTPRFGCINIHASILPRWRGAAPIQRAIEAGDKTTGVTIMQMDKGLDTGNMLLKKTLQIADSETGSSLNDRLADLGASAVIEYLSSVNWAIEKERRSTNNMRIGEAQKDSESSYAKKLSKSEAQINWDLPAAVIEKQVRAFNAWPVSFSFVNDQRIRIWKTKIVPFSNNPKSELMKPGTIFIKDKQSMKVVCGDGQLLEILDLQADGSKTMEISQFLNGKSHWFSPDAKFQNK